MRQGVSVNQRRVQRAQDRPTRAVKPASALLEQGARRSAPDGTGRNSTGTVTNLKDELGEVLGHVGLSDSTLDVAEDPEQKGERKERWSASRSRVSRRRRRATHQGSCAQTSSKQRMRSSARYLGAGKAAQIQRQRDERKR